MKKIMGLFGISKKNNQPMQHSYVDRYYYDTLDDIFQRCFNDATCEFAWDIWFERRDEVIWCKENDVIEQIVKNFKQCGDRQIIKLCAMLENSFDSRGDLRGDIVTRIKNDEENIIRNLRCMYSVDIGQKQLGECPSYIIDFRDKLYDLIYGRIEWTKENVKKITDIINNGSTGR